jgi:hypothetical protein
MAFVIVVPVDSQPARILRSLQPPVRMALWQRLRGLQPTVDSKRASGALGQIYQIKIQVEDVAHYFTIIFHFADTADENTLSVAEIILRTL